MKYLKRLGYNLLIVCSEIMALVSLVAVFAHWWSPTTSVFLVILFTALSGVLINFRRRVVPYDRPTLLATTCVVAVIVVLSAFAGIQPIASVKDSLFNKIDRGLQSIPTAPMLPAESLSLEGKWQKVVDNKISILSPTMQFLRNGTVIIDDGRTVVTGTYVKLADEYVKMTVETDLFGVPVKGVETMRYQIFNNKLTIRTGVGAVTQYERVE